MAGSLSGWKNRSSSASGRPLTKASAPPVRFDRRSSATVSSGGTTTSSGVGARSRMVPSTSSSTALDGSVAASINKSRSPTGDCRLAQNNKSARSLAHQGNRRRKELAGHHLNLSIEARFHFEFAVEG